MGVNTDQGLLPRQLADFIGVWEMRRVIRPAQGQPAQFNGQCAWRADGTGALCLETGQMLVPGQPAMQAERRYHWSGALGVTFDDGRPFHTVPPTGGAVAHWCDPDTYEGAYDFSTWPVFRVTWVVRGPRKDYRMETVYTRGSG